MHLAIGCLSDGESHAAYGGGKQCRRGRLQKSAAALSELVALVVTPVLVSSSDTEPVSSPNNSSSLIKE